MARQVSDGRRVPPGRNPSTGAAVLDLRRMMGRRPKGRICFRRKYFASPPRFSKAGLPNARTPMSSRERPHLLESLNAMLDSVIMPLNMSADYWTDLEGQYTPKSQTVTTAIQRVKNNINVCIDSLPHGERRADAHEGEQEGKLAIRPTPANTRAIPQDDRRRESNAGRGHRAAERLRRVRGPYLEGRYSAEDHRRLQRRLQRNQEQPEHLHRQHLAAGFRRPDTEEALWKANWPCGPTPPSTRAITARSSKA